MQTTPFVIKCIEDKRKQKTLLLLRRRARGLVGWSGGIMLKKKSTC